MRSVCLHVNVCQQLYYLYSLDSGERASGYNMIFPSQSKKSALLASFLGLTASDQKLDCGKAWERGYCVLIVYLCTAGSLTGSQIVMNTLQNICLRLSRQ